MQHPLEVLNAYGVAIVGQLTMQEIADVNAHFEARPVYRNAHIPMTAIRRGELPSLRHIPSGTACFCATSESALLAPHLFERALLLTDIAAQYLNVSVPFLYSVNAFWTVPGPEPLRGDIQEFHRDMDDTRFLVMFTYLTDVLTHEDGPHQLRGPDGLVHSIYGQAGTIFLSDTSNEHRGIKPTSKERGVHWFRWSVSERPAAYEWDGLAPVDSDRLGDRYPADARLRLSLRPLVHQP